MILYIYSILTEKMRIRSSHPEVFLGKGVLKICSKFTEHPSRIVISIKLPCNFIEIALRHGCSVNLLLIFRTPFTKNISGQLLLENGNYGILVQQFVLKLDKLYSLENYIKSIIFSSEVVFSKAIYKSSLYCQCQECHLMCTKNGTIANKAGETCLLKKENIMTIQKKEKKGSWKDISW